MRSSLPCMQLSMLRVGTSTWTCGDVIRNTVGPTQTYDVPKIMCTNDHKENMFAMGPIDSLSTASLVLKVDYHNYTRNSLADT